ncbi:MAG: hypothetical protein FWG20_04510 [Candidatus Cloacimonetes bacterium]|nr:hypothetical protein [Candidatus Cloacimonadota bacterium]
MENAIVFPAIRYGRYEITVTNPMFNGYLEYLDITSPEAYLNVSLLVAGSSGGFVFFDKGFITEGWQ